MKYINILFFVILFPLKAEIISAHSFLDLHNPLHNVAQLVFALTDYDDEADSPIYLLKEHIQAGNNVGLSNEVLQALEYAEWLLQDKEHEMSILQRKQLLYAIDNIVEAINEEFLLIDDIDLEIMPMRQTINNLTVTNSIAMNDSTSSMVGNILKNGQRFIHNFGTDNTKNNTFVGVRAGNFSTQGASNSGFGAQALRRVTTGRNNTAMGKDALTINTAGNDNTAVGHEALFENQTGNSNTAVGKDALRGFSGDVGGSFNVAIGREAMRDSSLGDYNIAIGYQSLVGSGSHNIAIGVGALRESFISEFNIGIGEDTLSKSIGNGNIAIGNKAGSVTDIKDDNIYLGHVGVSQDSNTMRLGQDGVISNTYLAGVFSTSVPAGIPVLINDHGQLGTTISSRKFKYNINTMNNSQSQRICDLNPVTFIYNDDETATIQFGLIAEEVDEIFPELVVRKNDGTPLTVRYEILPVLLLNEVKKQKRDMQQYEYDMALLKKTVADLQNKIQSFMAC